ncbi:hypothetical protein BH09VER1_BH09VER1_34290 [soil metagenome]
MAVALSAALFFLPTSFPLIATALYGITAAWMTAAILFGWCLYRRLSTSTLAKRADSALSLPDDLLSLSELDQAEDWRKAALVQTRRKIEELDLKKQWPVTWSRSTLLTGIAAVVLTGILCWQSWLANTQVRDKIARQQAEVTARVAAAEDVLRDWKEFAKNTDDPELKKLFTEAANLREAMQNKDPMAAMLEMNRIEGQMTKLQETVDKESMAPQAGRLAEALEAFEGMGAMSAALRNQNFGEAANEAEKLSQKLASNPDGSSNLRRDAAVAEMLSNESKTAASRGNQNLSDALSQMSQAASQSKQPGSVENNQLAPPTKSLQSQFSQEANRKNRGMAMSLSKSQLDTLRRRLRGDEECKESTIPSLCKSCCNSPKPGGSKAGTANGGDPKNEQTQLAAAATQESVTVQAGDGESEKRTTSATSGSGASAAGGKPATFADYAELSRKAVEDENLPLAHRQVIRTYFERIRPVAEPTKP